MWESILDSLQNSTPAFVIFTLAVLVGAALEWWVWGYVHRRDIARAQKKIDRLEREKIFWMSQALEAIGVGEDVVEVALDLAEEKAS